MRKTKLPEQDCHRGFSYYNETWYRASRPLREGVVHEMTVGVYHEEGGTTGEFSLRWYDLSSSFGQRRPPSLRIEAFDDSFEALTDMGDFLDYLRSVARSGSEGQRVGSVSPQEVMEALKKLGFKDQTAREVPERYRGEKEALTTEALQTVQRHAVLLRALDLPANTAVEAILVQKGEECLKEAGHWWQNLSSAVQDVWGEMPADVRLTAFIAATRGR